jgi:hypothetical protein
MIKCTCVTRWRETTLTDLERAYTEVGEPLPDALREVLSISRDDQGRHMSDCPHWVEWRDMDSFVYFIRSGTRGPIKIGKANNPAERLRSLQTANPAPLTLLGAIRGGEPVERSLQDYLSDHRLIGEWFHPSETVLSVIHGALVASALDDGASIDEALSATAALSSALAALAPAPTANDETIEAESNLQRLRRRAGLR